MIKERYLTPNIYSRPQRKDQFSPEAIAIHWVENPGTSATFNRNYFESLKDLKKYGSAHAIIDYQEIILVIPPDEVAFHVGKGGREYTRYKNVRFGDRYPNNHVLGIELCHETLSGEFSSGTLFQAKLLAALWCHEFGLDPLTDIVTHSMIVKKDCPRWWVNHPHELTFFRNSVKGILN